MATRARRRTERGLPRPQAELKEIDGHPSEPTGADETAETSSKKDFMMPSSRAAAPDWPLASRSASSRLICRPRANRLASELLRRHVRQRLGQLPTMASQVLEGAVTLAVVPVDRCLNDDRAASRAFTNAVSTSATRTRPCG